MGDKSKKRGSTLMEREMERSPDRAARIRAHSRLFTLEAQIQHAMTELSLSAKDLAERLHMDKAMLSRDLNGGLSKAKFHRIASVVEALGYEIIPLIVPVDTGKREESLRSAFDVLLREKPVVSRKVP
jgi:transcriptional regulator with XRE-family HTH domain